MPLASATHVGPYEIVSTLGGGAMGEVYRAHDSRLNRDVALKIIAGSGGANDAMRRRRFNQEARSASGLNHPNIVTVHDFGTVDGISYIASELIEGKSLRELIVSGPLGMGMLLDIAVQVADGLSAAHEAGIVHRDLKPENIMITPGGRVKILDFGLAKPVMQTNSGHTLDEFAEDTFDGTGTQPGLILGTVGYMSPEQARGLPVSVQSDQFSLGILLHEMATGQPAFKRETPMQTLLAIANVDRVPFTPGPVAFRMLVERCLQRDPARRFDSTVEVYERLRKIRDQLPEKAPAEPKLKRPAMARRVVRRSVLVAAAVCAAMLALGGFLIAFLTRGQRDIDLAAFHFTPVETGPGIAVFPALSGKRLAYAAEVDGIFQIFARRLDGSESTQLTRSSQDALFPFWSPDANRIYYIAGEALWSVAGSGGTAERLYSGVHQAAISPDGRTFALLRPDAKSGFDGLWYTTDDAAPKRYERGALRDREFLPSSYLRFSPDGTKLALWGATWNGRSQLWIAPWPEGEPREALPQLSSTPLARMFAWSPDSVHLLFGERQGLSRDDHLWRANGDHDSLHKLTNGTGREQAPALSGGTAAFSSVSLRYELVSLPLDSSARISPDPGNGEGSAVFPAWAPNGRDYAYVASRGSSPEILLHNQSSGWEKAVVSRKDFSHHSSSLLDLSFSPDGQRITYARSGPEGLNIWISTLAGEQPVRLAREPEAAFQRGPSWSPDGSSIAYCSMRSGHFAIMRAGVGTNRAPRVLNTSGATNPAWSPHGDWIAAKPPSGGLLLISPDGGESRVAGEGNWLTHAWSRNGAMLYGFQNRAGHLVLSGLPLTAKAGETAALIADLGPYGPALRYGDAIGSPALAGASLSPDGKSMLASILRIHSSLWLMTAPGGTL